jgi:LCP family protein required for cell wall assembly
MKIKKILVSVLVFVLVFFTSNNILDILQDKKMVENYGEAASEKSKKQLVDDELLILLVGVDKNSDDLENVDFTRTDTIMLCKMNIKNGSVDILSIPRDSRIQVRDDFTKANHAHAYGGIELTLQSLRNFLGIDIDYYAEVSYDAVVNIVDALGGVDYNVPKGIHVVKGGDVDIRPGMNHLNGNDVLWYLRTRHIYENGDLGRVDTQQEFLKGMVDEMVKKSSSINMITFLETYLKYVKTNVPMSILVDMATNISNFSSKAVTTQVVPGFAAMLGDTSYYIPDYKKTWKIINKSFKDYKLASWTKEDSGYREYEDCDYENETVGILPSYGNVNDGQVQQYIPDPADTVYPEDLPQNNYQYEYVPQEEYYNPPEEEEEYYYPESPSTSGGSSSSGNSGSSNSNQESQEKPEETPEVEAPSKEEEPETTDEDIDSYYYYEYVYPEDDE